MREPGPNRSRGVRTDLVHRFEVVLCGRDQVVQRAEPAGERRRRLLPDVADPEREEEPREVVLLAALDLAEQVRGGLFPPTLEAGEVVRRKRVDRGDVGEQPLANQLVDELLAEAFDPHRAAGAEVPERFPHHRGTGGIDAPRRDLPRGASTSAPR